MVFAKPMNPIFEKENINVLEMEQVDVIDKLIDDYGEEIKRLIFTYVKNEVDADDVLQEVFIAIYKKLHTFQGNSSLRSWLYSIAINKSKDYLRSWQSRSFKLKDKLIKHKQVGTQTETPEEFVLKQSETSDLLHKVLSLPIKYREVIVLFYFKEFSVREISATLNTNESTIKTRLNRGRDKLKTYYPSMERGDDRG